MMLDDLKPRIIYLLFKSLIGWALQYRYPRHKQDQEGQEDRAGDPEPFVPVDNTQRDDEDAVPQE